MSQSKMNLILLYAYSSNLYKKVNKKLTGEISKANIER